VLGVVCLCVLGIWVLHGGALDLTRGWLKASASLTQISGLAASTTGLLGLVIVGRPRTLERHFGLDRLFVWLPFMSP
jgi:hypothetical protein